MNDIKKILCPIDFSEYANEALKYALLLAEKNLSELHLFHVLPKMNYYDWNMNGVYPLISEDIIDNERDETNKKLLALVDKLKFDNPNIEIYCEMVDTNNISDTIVSIARKTDIDLIIMGSHGRKGLDRLLMGSVAEAVLRNAHCNVLIYKMRTT
ncbi:MAG: universal stress protein [Bacteroidetes bacterium]|nr:universal stress protein [Bacteroidota bacterium]